MTTNKSSICIVDTGIYPHIDMVMPKLRIVKFIDIINQKTLPYDDNGHGSMIAGIVAGNGLCSGRKIISPSPNANLIVIKAVDCMGKTTILNSIIALNIVYSMLDKYNIGVLLLCFGADRNSIKSSILESKINAIASKNVTVVCAVGNDASDIITVPAIYDKVISVGSVDRNMNVSDFTTHGIVNGVKKPDFYAIGEDVVSTSSSMWYEEMTGTSMSAPYVASLIHRIREELNINDKDTIVNVLKRLSYKHNGIYIL